MVVQVCGDGASWSASEEAISSKSDSDISNPKVGDLAVVVGCSAGAATSGESSSSCFLDAAATAGVAKTSFDGDMQRMFHLFFRLCSAAARFDIPSRVACA